MSDTFSQPSLASFRKVGIKSGNDGWGLEEGRCGIAIDCSHTLPLRSPSPRATNQMGLYKPAEHEVDESVLPLVQFFELVHVGDTIAQMVQVYYDTELVRAVCV